MKTPETIYLKDYTPADFLVDHIDLTFDIEEDQTRVTSLMQIHRNQDIKKKNTKDKDSKDKDSKDKSGALVLDKGPFKIVSVIADGMVLLPGEYESGEDYFKLAATPDRFRLEIVSLLKPRENTSLQGLYMSGDIFCTQCEAQGFRKITPFLDRPDVMARYSCTIIADKTRYPVLLSNGNPVASGDLDKNRHYVRWEDPFKKPSYLFALVADPETATDDDFMNIQGVIAHEYFHNWTGNRVTLKNWFQLSLKEGLTVFRDQEFSSDMNSRAVKRISCVRNLRAFQFPEDAGPMTHPVRPESYMKMDNFYTMTVYEKGAELVRMVHQILGESFFRKGMDLYFERFDGMAVTIEDFVSVMEEVSGIDLTQFKLWYSQSGTPLVNLTRYYDPDNKTLALTFEQATEPDRNQKKKQALHIPVCIGIMDCEGNDITPEKSSLVQLKSEKETFVFENMSPDTYPSVFRQFSAPVKLSTDFSDSDLAFFMANDLDEFNRWDAAQILFIQETQNLVSAIQEQRNPRVSPALVQAFKKALTDPDIDRAFLAKALLLPQETEIKDHYDIIDVNAIHQARIFLKKELARKLTSEFYDIMKKCSIYNPLGLSHKAISDRSLKNLALSYIGSLQEKETTSLVFKQFETAENMTDEFAALRILSNIDPDISQAGIQAFYKKWSHDKLVLDKWFAVQAASYLDDTLERVQSLTGHGDFSMTNPNKVRSLIYMFAIQNPINFHRKDGKGYEFIADQILDLDKINPQISARLASCFNQWKKYDTGRQGLMEKALKTIIGEKGLSKNTYEIVSRALE